MSNEPLHPNDISLYRSKSSSDLTDPQPYFLMKNAYKPYQTFDFHKTDQHFVFKSFHGFLILFAKVGPIVSTVFYLIINPQVIQE